MPVNKVILGAVAIMDISDSTVTPGTLAEGITAYDKAGNKITGTMKSSEDLTAVLDEQESKLDTLIASLDGKAAGGGEGDDNHSLYQRVEYIVSDSNQYIITDFIADNECGMELIASFPALEDRIPMGSREDSGSTRFYVVYPLSATSVYYGFNGGSSISCRLSTDTVYRLQTNFVNSRLVNVYDINGIRLGGDSISDTLTQQTVPVSIFGYHSASNGAISSRRHYTFYGARCSRGNEVVREYIPCYRKSDGEIGLYEKFTGEFLTNAGTGEFVKGADIDW